jgi:hypothetical protein
MDMRNTGSSITPRMRRVLKGCPKAFIGESRDAADTSRTHVKTLSHVERGSATDREPSIAYLKMLKTSSISPEPIQHVRDSRTASLRFPSHGFISFLSSSKTFDTPGFDPLISFVSSSPAVSKGFHSFFALPMPQQRHRGCHTPESVKQGRNVETEE